MAAGNIGRLSLSICRADGMTFFLPDGRTIRLTTEQQEQTKLLIEAPDDILIMRDKALSKKIAAEAADQ